MKQMVALCSSALTLFSSYFAVFVLLLLLFVSQVCSSSELFSSPTVVKFLPGFEGPLPFHLETGYVGVGESEDVHLFYYFVKSQRNPIDDPIMLWLTGGPGCSVMFGLAFEIGPFTFKMEEYNGSLPSLVRNSHSWTKVSSIIFVDLPANTGFSYTKRPEIPERSDSKQIQHALQFLRKWLIQHPEFLSNRFYVGGDSYSGIIVPPLAFEILKGNEDNVQPSINFQGYILGNPETDLVNVDQNARVPFAHGMGLISDELYESLKSNCGGEYQNVDPRNEKCARDVKSFQKLISGLYISHILEPYCPTYSGDPQHPFPTIECPSLKSNCGGEYQDVDHSNEKCARDIESFQKLVSGLCTSQILEPYCPTFSGDPQQPFPTIECPTYGDILAHYWANDNMVQKALGVRQGSIRKWQVCKKSSYTFEIKSSFQFHVKLGSKGYRSLIYSGDHDMIIPFCGTEAWIRSLNYSVVDEWRQWLVQGQVAGYTRHYSNGMTFATIKGAGHTAPVFKPKECFAMFERWISHKPF